MEVIELRYAEHPVYIMKNYWQYSSGNRTGNNVHMLSYALHSNIVDIEKCE